MTPNYVQQKLGSQYFNKCRSGPNTQRPKVSNVDNGELQAVPSTCDWACPNTLFPTESLLLQADDKKIRLLLVVRECLSDVTVLMFSVCGSLHTSL